MSLVGKIFSFQLLYNFNKQLCKMSQVEKLIANNKLAEELLSSLKNQLAAIKNEKIVRLIQILERENTELRIEVESAKTELISLEIKNGKKQIPVPEVIVKTEGIDLAKPQKPVSEANETIKVEAKTPKEKKPAKEKKSENKQAAEPDGAIDVGRLDFRVGKIIDVQKHPDADSLYVEKIDCGEPNPRTVVSGLVKFIPIEEMKNRLVVILCNLKPAKMRGVTSEAMVMCASTADKVEILAPPSSAIPGDLVHCEGYTRNPDAQLNPKKKIFETCAPDLLTNSELAACYKGTPWIIPGKGTVKAQSLKNVQVK